MTQEAYLKELRSGVKMQFKDLMALVDDNFNHTPASFTNGALDNSEDENQGSAKFLALLPFIN